MIETDTRKLPDSSLRLLNRDHNAIVTVDYEDYDSVLLSPHSPPPVDNMIPVEIQNHEINTLNRGQPTELFFEHEGQKYSLTLHPK